MIKINGETIKTPARCTVGIIDIGARETRNALGEMLVDRIAQKRRLDMEWGVLTNAEASGILSAVLDVYFEVEYPDPQTGTNRIMVGYIEDKEAPMLMYGDSTPRWEGLRLTIMER